MSDHAERAARFTADAPRTHWHDEALWAVRVKRDRASADLPGWEALRARASAIKAHTRGRLAEYLEQFEREAARRGTQVHWARDAEEHNRIVHGLLAARGITRVVKSKSMLTEECHLNGHLEARGIEVVDTDLGERIVQLAGEPPSHIVLPAIHRRREEIGELFHRTLGTAAGASDPDYLTRAARAHLRERFLRAQAGLTGVNFAVAETGGIVVCTNEGNADMGTSLPRVHIASMGVEKVVPRLEHLGVFLRLLARSATGQLVTTYTSHFHGPMAGGELHVVIVDNGRSALLAEESFREALACIRCGACMNTCPVFRRSGGHSYGWTIPGPIGAVLAPGRDPRAHRSLPFASSLCGSCDDVCPVRIPLHGQLLDRRRELVSARVPGLFRKALAMRLLRGILGTPWLYRLCGLFARLALRRAPRWLLHNRWNVWGRRRELPAAPAASFRQEWRRRGGARG
jgi:L-lactate dehydrogenase complex protein LldF